MNRQILLIISGSIAAYKALELIRLLKKEGIGCRCVLTKGGAEFITPLSVAALSEEKVYTELFSLNDESEMGHIRLSREADLVVVAPASANMLAKMAAGIADDLASTLLLATDKPVVVVPAMNPQMWQHAATARAIQQLQSDGVRFIGPDAGETACGEMGLGRMRDVPEVVFEIVTMLRHQNALAGLHALVTAGPTQEAIDPVRYISNHSSGKQGYAIAEALAQAGARVTLVSGPTALATPAGATRVSVTTAAEMLAACEAALPADIFVSTAAVADWTPAKPLLTKLKKRADTSPPALALQETVDILHHISHHPKRPALVIGFAAETQSDGEMLRQAAEEKRGRKGCDWLIANDVSEGRIFGADTTAVTLLCPSQCHVFSGSKKAMAAWLVERIIRMHPIKTLTKVPL
jgi:phosphopantothenoylcysteine decarboxylase/phosphopantothenate--cysteine ligase